MIRSFAALAFAATALFAAGAASSQPAPAASPKFETHQADFVVRDFKFRSGEVLPELKLHYTTLGTPRRDAKGRITNAVLILHGTGGDGNQFLRPQFSGVLFVPGGLLDPARYFIILPDDIGHGKSSKPSDGLHARFPQYDYDDMVEAEHLLTTKALGVERLRLIMGTSMGCMHAFVWGETWPDGMDALMPLACQPMEIAGRNRMWRRMTIDAIRNDPDWKGGEYATQPQGALRVIEDLLLIAGSAPHQMQKSYPTGAAADAYLQETFSHGIVSLDANDFLYQVASSRTYNPEPDIERITAPVMWVNSADDFINPPDLGPTEALAHRLKHGRYVLIPTGPNTHGHGTHTWAVNWQSYLAELLKQSERP
jgi:homoserine O-acetyltransferase